MRPTGPGSLYNTGVNKIVAGVDGSDASRNALRWAVAEAELRDAEVVAVHAWEVPIAPIGIPPFIALDDGGMVSDIREGAEELLEKVVDEAAGSSSVKVTPLAVEGPAAASLIDAARDADLLVVGSRGLGGFTSLLLGSVSHHCVTHAPCPVLVHRVQADSS
jgi:nucleotide-binding universal stress UspA family protein